MNLYDKIPQEAHDILIKQLQKLKHHDKITTAVEGFVFQYGDQVYKFTGNFAPVNQILGLFRYGRGKTVPPIAADLQEQEGDEEITRQRMIALVPGAYKPPHRGHFEMVKHYSSEVGPNGVVYVIISPLSRGGGEEAEGRGPAAQAQAGRGPAAQGAERLANAARRLAAQDPK